MKKVVTVIIFLSFFINAVWSVETNEQKLISYIQNIYVTVLDREADEGGLRYWTKALKEGEKTPKQMIEYFFFSEEFLSKKLDERDFITVAYKAVLQKDLLPEDIESKVESLQQNDIDRKKFIDELLNSLEFQKISQSLFEQNLTPVIEVVKMIDLQPFWAGGQTVKLVQLDGSKSNSKEGKIIKYIWKEGSCQGKMIDMGRKMSVYYTTAGTHRVALEITDDKNNTACKEKSFEVKNITPPSVPEEQNLIITQ